MTLLETTINERGTVRIQTDRDTDKQTDIETEGQTKRDLKDIGRRRLESPSSLIRACDWHSQLGQAVAEFVNTVLYQQIYVAHLLFWDLWISTGSVQRKTLLERS